jgi:hypothetical protein
MSLTAAEKTIVEQTNAAIAAGEDPFGDNDGLNSTSTPQSAAADTDNAAGEQDNAGQAAESGDSDNAADKVQDTEAKTDDEDIDPDVLAAIANGDDTPARPVVADPLNFNVNAPADYKATRASLISEKAEAMAKLMSGEIDAGEYAAIEARVMDGLEDLSAQRIRAETLQEVNTQSAAQSQQTVIQSLIERTKTEVPYASDAKAQRQFDMAMQGLSADPDMAGKSFSDLANEAHKVVLALRGIAPKPNAADVAAAAEARKPDGKAPVTLRGIPAASTANAGGNIAEQLSRLSGQEYEAAYNKLTPQQKASMLDD